jgi:hypothetical protein
MGDGVNSTKRAARIAGLLYLVISIPGFFGLMYVPSALIVSGDAAATAHNIAVSETLFRCGIVANVLGQAGFVFVAFALYRLLKGVNQHLAALMVALILVSVPITIINEVNHLAVLSVVGANGSSAALGAAQTEAMVRLYLNQYRDGILIAEIFWGLWLFPLALLVIKSGFLPRILGVLLIIAGIGWLAQSVSSLLSPALGHEVSRVTSVLTAGELPFMLWLIIMGAKDRPLES